MIYKAAEDSELIKRHIRRYAEGKVLDMGAGSGVLAIEAKKYAKSITASDINPECKTNLARHSIPFIHSDLFQNITEKYDLILFNPPYLPEDKDEPESSRIMTTGGKKGNEIIERFLGRAKFHLNSRGKILLVASSLTPEIPELFQKHNYSHELIDSEQYFFEKINLYLLGFNTC